MNTVKTLRILAFLECLSSCLLFFVAMPMKYMLDNPVFIRPVGMLHGVLFIVFFVALLVVCQLRKWPLKMFIIGLVSAIIPLACIWLDKEIKQIENMA